MRCSLSPLAKSNAVTGIGAPSVAPSSAVRDEDGITRLLGEFAKRKGFICGFALFGILLGCVAWVWLPVRYTAEAILLLQPQEIVAPELSLVRAFEATVANVRSEAAIIESREVLEGAWARLGGTGALAELSQEKPLGSIRAALLGGGQRRDGFLERSWVRLRGIMEGFGLLSRAEPEPRTTSRQDSRARNAETMEEGVEKLSEGLDIRYNNLDMIIRVAYTHYDSDSAARIANAITQAYLELGAARRRALSDTMVRVLTERAESLRQRVRHAEQAVEDFRLRNGVVATSEGLMVEQEIAELNRRLSLAKADLANHRAALEDANAAVEADAVGEVLDSDTIQDLRRAEAEVDQGEARLLKEFGPNHPLLQQARRERDSIQNSIALEVRRILGKLASGVKRSEEEVELLEQAVAGLQARAVDDAANQSKLRLLESEAESDRSVYEAFVARLEQAKSMQDSSSSVSLISSARTPREPSSPPPLALAALGGVTGFFISALFIIVRTYRDRGFVSLSELSQETGIRGLGSLPLDRARLGDPRGIVALLSRDPTSLVAESLRGSRVQLLGPEDGEAVTPPRATIVGVTSSLQNEGKSTFALGLAATAAQDGYSALLVECDLRKPCLLRKLEENTTIKEFAGDGPWRRIVLDRSTGLHIMPVLRTCARPHLHLRKENFGAILEGLAKSYDIVVLDTPPVMHVADAIVLSRQVDATILLVAYQHAKRSEVRETVRRIIEAHGTVDGVVFSKAKGIGSKAYYYGYGGRRSGRSDRERQVLKRMLTTAGPSESRISGTVLTNGVAKHD